MAVTRLGNAMEPAHREEIDLHMAEIDKKELVVRVTVAPEYDFAAHVLPVRTVARTSWMPSYAHAGDAGADLRACMPGPLTINPGESAWVNTGVRVAIPDGFVGLQFPRSGLGCNHGICLANGTGVIDSGYRGEVRAKLLNLGRGPFTVHPGDRVCQLVVVPCVRASFLAVTELPDSERGTDGYGSTGVR